MKRTTLALAALVVILATCGCKSRSAPPAAWPPAGFAGPGDGLCMRMDLRRGQETALGGGSVLRFYPDLAMTLQRPGEALALTMIAQTLEYRVFRADGSEVPPTVVRPDRGDKEATSFTISGQGRFSYTWPTPLPSTVVQAGGKAMEEDGKPVCYGNHTLDTWTKAWDLPPGRYVVRACFSSKATLPPPPPPTRLTDGSTLPTVFWAGSIDLPPVEIEVPPVRDAAAAAPAKTRELPCCGVPLQEALAGGLWPFVAVCEGFWPPTGDSDSDAYFRTCKPAGRAVEKFKIVEILAGQAPLGVTEIEFPVAMGRTRFVRHGERVIWVASVLGSNPDMPYGGLAALPDTLENRQAVKKALDALPRTRTATPETRPSGAAPVEGYWGQAIERD